MNWLCLLKESDLTQIDVRPELKKVDELIRILTSICKTTKENPAAVKSGATANS